jgi:hypothetical protein
MRYVNRLLWGIVIVVKSLRTCMTLYRDIQQAIGVTLPIMIFSEKLGESFIRELYRASQAAAEMRSTPKLSLNIVQPDYAKAKKRYKKSKNFLRIF